MVGLRLSVFSLFVMMGSFIEGQSPANAPRAYAPFYGQPIYPGYGNGPPVGGHFMLPNGMQSGPQFLRPQFGGYPVYGQFIGNPILWKPPAAQNIVVGGQPGTINNPFINNGQNNQLVQGGSNTCPPRIWSITNCPQKPPPFLVDINDDIKEIIISLHNQGRDLLIAETTPQFGIRPNLPTMSWNVELASLAEGNVMKCKMEHDACSASIFTLSGQNVAIHSYGGPIDFRSNKDLVKSSIELWWRQYKTQEAPMQQNSWVRNPLGYFAELAKDKYMAVGCAASRFFQDNLNKVLIACNYAIANQFGMPIRKLSATEEYEKAAGSNRL